LISSVLNTKSAVCEVSSIIIHLPARVSVFGVLVFENGCRPGAPKSVAAFLCGAAEIEVLLVLVF
jgi:hypothetical protein